MRGALSREPHQQAGWPPATPKDLHTNLTTGLPSLTLTGSPLPSGECPDTLAWMLGQHHLTPSRWHLNVRDCNSRNTPKPLAVPPHYFSPDGIASVQSPKRNHAQRFHQLLPSAASAPDFHCTRVLQAGSKAVPGGL